MEQYKIYFVKENKKGFFYCDKLKEVKKYLEKNNIKIYLIQKFNIKLGIEKRIYTKDYGFKDFINKQYLEITN